MGIYDLYGVTSYIGDFVSYSRLMALGISGGSIAAAFNLLVGYMPPVARFSVGIILLVILQALNIFVITKCLRACSAFTICRIFGKFFTGGGRAFDTFKPSEKYVDFEKKTEERKMIDYLINNNGGMVFAIIGMGIATIFLELVQQRVLE